MVGTRDTNFELLRDLNVRVPQAIEGNLEDGDVLLGELADVRAVTGQGQEGVMNRTRKVISLWNLVNTSRAAATLPALEVGETTVANLAAALDAHPELLQDVEDEGAVLSRLKGQLARTDARVDRNNKRWYVAWSGNFLAGSPEIDALSQIDTGPSAPAPVGKAVITHAVFVAAGSKAYMDFDADHATKFAVWRKAPGESTFTVRVDGLEEGTFDDAGLTPGTYQYQVVGSNSGGNGEASDSVSVVVT